MNRLYYISYLFLFILIFYFIPKGLISFLKDLYIFIHNIITRKKDN